MAVTIKELSKRCGFSISTVSKALNGYPDISEETREKVIREARAIGYFPNLHARALKTKRSYNLGVLFSDDNQSGLTHPFFSYVLESFKKEAERRGYDVTFISHNIGENQMTYLEHCNYREVDGVCIACIDFLEPEITQLVNSDMHVVTIDHLFSSRTCIQSDNINGTRQLVKHIYEKGHRKIANIHGPHSAVTDTRLGSFYRTLEELGIAVPDEYVLECEYNEPESVYMATQSLLNLKNRPTCIMISDDYAVLGAYDAISSEGLRVPADISIAGYDGIPMMQMIKPRLTTIRQNTARLGAEAARKLVKLIENPKTAIPEIVRIPCTLLEGETVASIGG
ncbi:MAG TPA: LacI family DNA-binding transcriptional regulator [Candidatus Limiplasma sp.]|nr:LacI family DNA-binding transcriptional regulator [Candidatus Limiplasma sp.]